MSLRSCIYIYDYIRHIVDSAHSGVYDNSASLCISCTCILNIVFPTEHIHLWNHTKSIVYLWELMLPVMDTLSMLCQTCHSNAFSVAFPTLQLPAIFYDALDHLSTRMHSVIMHMSRDSLPMLHFSLVNSRQNVHSSLLWLIPYFISVSVHVFVLQKLWCWSLKQIFIACETRTIEGRVILSGWQCETAC